MIILNPEFHRYLWLNFSPFRLIIMPLVLVSILYIAALSDLKIWPATVFRSAINLYGIIIFLWGNYAAAAALSKDMQAQTWDFQKMSALSPWQLTIGKLFGATSYVWYGGIILLIIVAATYSMDETIEHYGTMYSLYPTAVLPIAYLIFAGIIGHATAMLVGINNLCRKGNTGTIGPFLAGMIASSMVINGSIGYDLAIHQSTHFPEIKWYIFVMPLDVFLIASNVYCLTCLITGVQRGLREELQYKNSPGVLTLFLASLCIYSAGIFDTIPHANPTTLYQPTIAMRLALCFFIILPCTYLMVLAEAKKIHKYARWWYAFQNKEWKRVWLNTPGWVGCLALLLPIYAVLNILAANAASSIDENFKITTITLTTACILFMVRDGLIVHTIAISQIDRHKSFVIALYYALIYGLLPLTILLLIAPEDIDSRQQAMMFFLPLGMKSLIASCLPIALQCAGAITLLLLTLKGNSKSQKKPTKPELHQPA